MIMKSQLKISYEKTHRTLLLLLYIKNIHKTYEIKDNANY